MDFRREFIRLQFTQARDTFDEYTVRTKFQIHIYLFIQTVKASIWNALILYITDRDSI